MSSFQRWLAWVDSCLDGITLALPPPHTPLQVRAAGHAAVVCGAGREQRGRDGLVAGGRAPWQQRQVGWGAGDGRTRHGLWRGAAAARCRHLTAAAAPVASSVYCRRVAFAPAQHWSIRSPGSKKQTLWGSWAVLGKER